MRSTRIRTMAATVGAVAMLVTVGVAGSASGAPTTWLPDAEIWCEGATAGSQWVAIPPAGTLWIEDGDFAGHYVILSSAHYFAPGYVEVPPSSYDEEALLEARTIGTKKGLEGRSITCDFVSRFPDGPNGPFSVVGPLQLAKVSG